jgi:Peptidase S46
LPADFELKALMSLDNSLPSTAFRVLLLVSTLLGPTPWAAEGKWTPQQVLELGPKWVKSQGFQLPLEKLWNPKEGGGLLSNAVQLPGCSGSFVSKDGLLITNHHCVVGILQEHSSTQSNLVKDGFVAAARESEKKASAFRILVPKSFKDVTKEVNSVIPANADDITRYKAVESAQKQLVAACEKAPGTRCTFASFDGGLFFTLTEFAELTDLRLVYAPPSSVGDYGEETDNWMWPRHAGDFALLRAYENDKPYAPKYFFPVSTEGVKPGDAVAVLGYPGVSFRSYLSSEMAERETKWYPAIQKLMAEWLQLADDEAKKDAAVGIAIADAARGQLNTKKNAEGQMAGLKRGQLVVKQKAFEERVKLFAQKNNLADSLSAFESINQLTEKKFKSWERDFLLDMSSGGSRGLSWPLMLVRHAVELKRPDVEREPGYQDRDQPRLKERHERDQKRLALAVEKRLLVSWLKRALALPEGQRIAAVDAAFKGLAPDALPKKVDELFAASKIFDLETRKKMFDETPELLLKRNDALLNFGLKLDIERRALRDTREGWAGAILKLRPLWRKAVLAEAQAPVAPDANSTLRVTFGKVAGYSPRDALSYDAQTRLAGAVEKHLGEAPFDLPQKIRVAAAAAPNSRFADKRLKDVPVDFLADCDTTGGNSGSPTIDGKGQLVGVNFDRVWENVANDFGYNPSIARNVNADVRYLLWMLEEVEKAPGLVQELTAAPAK